MAKKELRAKVYLICSVCKNKNYTTNKNTLNTKEKIELKKHCKKCNKHTVHIEGKK